MTEFDEELDLPPEEIHRLRELAREVTLADGQLEAPPASVWAGIQAAIDSGADDDADRGSTDGARNQSNVVPMKPRRNWIMAAAAAVVLVLGFTAVFALSADNDVADDRVATVDIVNNDLPVSDDASGMVTLVRTKSGYELDVDVESVSYTHLTLPTTPYV